MDEGQLVYEYNMMIIERYIARSTLKIAPGKRRIEVTTQSASPKSLSPADVVLKVDGQQVAHTAVKRTAQAAFSRETFDVGVDLGSVVSLDYFDRRPFRFNGEIEKVEVNLKLNADMLRMSALGQKRTNRPGPKSSVVRCYSNSGQRWVRSDCPLCAKSGHLLTR